MEKVGIFYGSTTGYTKGAAETMADKLGTGNAVVFNIADTTINDIKQFKNIIFGASTWGLGEIQDDWSSFLDNMNDMDFTGKKVAIFGYGDQNSFADTFVDAIGIIYERVVKKGGIVVGKVSGADYDFAGSLAFIDGEFAGLPLDDNNQGDLTESRISDWIVKISAEFN